VRGLVLAADQGPVVQAALTVYEQVDDVPTCVSALGTGGVAVVRGRGESDDQGSAAVVLPRAAVSRAAVSRAPVGRAAVSRAPYFLAGRLSLARANTRSGVPLKP
jgi:hypothetical protein